MGARNPLALADGTLLGDPDAVHERRARLADPHVAPLEAWAQHLRDATGESVPSVDPLSGGSRARLLVLREEPRCLATTGTGIVSIDNDDAAAHHTTLAQRAAGLAREDVLHWNVVPWWIRNPATLHTGGARTVVGQSRRVREDVATFLGLLPSVRCVLLLGRAAVKAWSIAGDPALPALTAPHPSPLAWNTRDASTGRRCSELTIEAFGRAADLANGAGPAARGGRTT